MLTLERILVAAAIIGSLVNAMGKMPLWPAVLVLGCSELPKLFP